MSVGQMAMQKIRSTFFTFLILCNLEAAPEEAMQLRRLIMSSNESYVGNSSFGIFKAPRAKIPRGQYLKKPASNRVDKSKLNVPFAYCTSKDSSEHDIYRMTLA